LIGNVKLNQICTAVDGEGITVALALGRKE